MASIIDKVTNLVSGGSSSAAGALGKNGPQVQRLGYGTMGLSAFYGAPKPDEERYAVLDHVYNSGELFWDTADVSRLSLWSQSLRI